MLNAFASVLTKQWRKITHPKRVRILTQLLKANGTETANGQYAIMAFGNVIKGGTYKAKPYVKYTDHEGGKDIAYGTERTVILN